jgi:hypothetical protein
MTPLRQQMIAALHRSGQGERPPPADGRDVRLRSTCSGTSPDVISTPERQDSCLYRQHGARRAPASRRLGDRGIRCVSPHVLTPDWPPLSRLRAHTAHRLPAGLRGPAVRPLLTAATPWHVPSPAHPNGQPSCPSLAPAVCKGASSQRRLVSRQDRTVTCTSRPPGRARPRPTPLDALALLRRCLPPVLPAGGMTVRHCGCLTASRAIPPDSRRRMVLQRHASACPPPAIAAPPPVVASCPAWGPPMRGVRRLWPPPRALVDTGGTGGRLA